MIKGIAGISWNVGREVKAIELRCDGTVPNETLIKESNLELIIRAR